MDITGWDIKMRAEKVVEQIKNGTFNWHSNSKEVAMHCPGHFDPEKFNWDRASGYVIWYCPEHFDPEKFNWRDYSDVLARHCPEFIDVNRFNWDDMHARNALVETLRDLIDMPED